MSKDHTLSESFDNNSYSSILGTSNKEKELDKIKETIKDKVQAIFTLGILKTIFTALWQKSSPVEDIIDFIDKIETEYDLTILREGNIFGDLLDHIYVMCHKYSLEDIELLRHIAEKYYEQLNEENQQNANFILANKDSNNKKLII